MLVFTPFRLHADMEVQEHAGAEEALEILSGRGPDALDHLSPAPDHDRLLRLPVHDDGAVQLEKAFFACRGVLEAVDDDGARKRDLRMRELQEFLADDLAG